MDDKLTEKRNNYANKLIETDKEYLDIVNDLVTSVNKLQTLHWVKFSRELDYIKDLYKSRVIDIVLDYKKEFEKDKLSDSLISDRMKEFGKICNTKFDETYDYFESINGLK